MPELINATEGLNFGEWQSEGPLGVGTFSPVLLVRRARDQTTGALKRADRDVPAAIERLQVEATSLPRFEHPGIPRLLDKDLGSQVPYIVMERAPGQTIQHRLNEWNQLGRVHGELEAINIIRQLLSALAHVHSHDMVHRDIKDANVMYDGTTVTLIDFGFCKPTYQRDLRTKDSFWRAGAARFAPLGKLDDHTVGIPRQDVFAVGVIAYLLVTGAYPYGEEDGDLSALKERYRSFRPPSAHELNRMISPGFSRLIEQMLEMSDERRITAVHAHDSLEAISADARQYALEKLGPFSGRVIRARRATYPHVVRDPVIGDVRITDLEYQILNTREMQRLRWIRQLGLTNLIYPGADHSRLSHSIGTLGNAERMLRAIEDESGERVDAEVRTTTRLYALTHDVTHIAMGHTLEDQLGFFARHDSNNGRFDRLINSDVSDVGQLLSQSSEGRSVKAILDPSASSELTDGVPYQAVSGDMGADVLDYLDRDAYFCGLDHRIDTAIYRQLAIDGPTYSNNRQIVSRVAGKYGIRTDRGYAIDSLLGERYAMFLKVYNHSAKITADSVLDKAMRALANGRALPEERFEWFGDESLLEFLIASRREVVHEYGVMLKQRRLPRGVFRVRVAEALPADVGSDINQVRSFLTDGGYLSSEGRSTLEGRIAKEAGLRFDQVFFYIPKSAPGYKRADLWVSQGAARSRHQASGDLPRRHLNLWEMWVFVNSKDHAERLAAADAAEHITGFRNSVDIPNNAPRLI